jgi:hypothetical protein
MQRESKHSQGWFYNIIWCAWTGSILAVIAIIGLAVVLREIAKKTKELEEL